MSGGRPGVAEGPAHHPNAALQRIIADKLPRPQPLEQLLLGDHAVVVLHEIDEHVEHLGAQRDALPRPAQFIELRVEGILAKDVEHRPHPPPGPGARGHCSQACHSAQGLLIPRGSRGLRVHHTPLPTLLSSGALGGVGLRSRETLPVGSCLRKGTASIGFDSEP